MFQRRTKGQCVFQFNQPIQQQIYIYIYIYICQQEYLISPICRCGSWQFTHPLTGLVGSVLNKYMQLSISCLESGTG